METKYWIWHFMQIVSNGDNLHEMSNLVFWEKNKKNIKFVVCWISPESGKNYLYISGVTFHCFQSVYTSKFCHSCFVDVDQKISFRTQTDLQRYSQQYPFCFYVLIIINPFTPKFLKWPLRILNLHLSTVGNRMPVKNQNQDLDCFQRYLYQSAGLKVATSENISLTYALNEDSISAYTSAQSDQKLCCPHEETLHPWLSKMRPVKILIRLRKSSLGVQVWR